ncbi:hypothetical protein BDA99DRAFT_608896 [Phascolomyces articulosus]|uniref:Guanylate cyclase domain-containing protein n=1 Tax=Phascolomyces articulosus TaxID=60185 RepID=A0AAD5K0U5_9FUNG|nr:hypothetical protein BDA99DRAFT_608896 [Phascolomyces articulosus]
MTLATEKGESGAEAIALEVGAYMGECIRIIEFYGGDVVKFLGDAVLVCFQPNIAGRNHTPDVSPLLRPHDHEVSSRKKNTLLRRAVECGLQLLARLSHYQVYLTAEERSKHRNPSGEIRRGSMEVQNTGPRYNIFDIRNEYERQSQLHPLQQQQQQQQQKQQQEQEENDDINTSKQNESIRDRLKWFKQEENRNSNDKRRFIHRLEENESLSLSFSRWGLMRFFKQYKGKKQRRMSEGSVSTRDLRTIDLELHIALGCGEVTNIIVGEVDPEDAELNWSKSYRHSLLVKQDISSSSWSDYYLQYHGRLEYAIGGPVVASLDEALSIAKAGEMSITQEAYERIRPLSMDFLSYDKRGRYYVIKDKDPGADHGGGTQKHKSPTSSSSWFHAASSHQENPNASYLQDKPGLMRKASQLSIEPLVPRIRNKSYMQLSAEANPYYYKYVNRSAVYRLSRTVDGNFQSQFRDITIMFVSLGQVDIVKDEGLQAVQDAMLAVTKSLVRYEGVLQQFAIDDKGATILCVFGLPPYSHEREAVFAAKSAIDVRDQLRKIDRLPEFAISLATGVIFNAVVPQGNPYRRDPGIAGDAIIIAVRMLKFPFSKRHVICDEATRQQIGGLCEFDDLGENYVKGKIKPIQIYGIQKFGLWAGKRKRYPVRPTNIDFVGYKVQMERATTFVNDWCEIHNHHLMIISGSSGAGKTYFCQNLQESVMSDDLTVCWSSCTEVEKRTKYFLVRSMLTSLMDLIISSEIPTETDGLSSVTNTKRTPTPDPECTVVVDEKSEISSIRSNRILRRIQSYRRKHPKESFRINQELTENNIPHTIVYCLNKCGEDDIYLPLFRNIFPSMGDFDENQYTQRLDERTRDRILRNLVLRMVQYVSDYMNLVFICDDLQWSDTASIECLKQIHVVCNNVLLIIASRPLQNYPTTFVDEMRKTGSFEHIILNGLNSDEIGYVVLQSFPDSVKEVSSSITRPIQERTNGNPLYVKNVAILLKDFNHVTVSNDQLIPRSNRFELEDLLGDFNFKRIIKMQYDRLDANFQEFLTIASCLDQHFSVFEVRAVIMPENEIFHHHDFEQIRNEIHKRDSYNFLKSGYHGNPIENSSDLYSFSHITIPDCIYDMVSFETRNDIHQRLARYYEGQLNRENYAQLLGKVTRHYLQTDRLGKQLYYLESLARLDMRSFLLPDAAGHLKQIVVILEDNQDLAKQYGLVHQSDIYRKLGICLTMRSEFGDGEIYLLKSLQCLGFPWPTNNLEFFWRFWMVQISQWQHRHNIRLCFYFKKYHSTVKKELGRRIIETMVQLCHIYYIKGIGDKFIFACLIGLNQCERTDDQGYRYAYFLGRAAMVNWINDNKKAGTYYMARALALMGDRPDPGILNACAILCFSAGKFEKARKIFYQAIKATQTLGVVTDCQEFYRAVRVVMTIRIFEGTLDSSPGDKALMKQMADTAHCNGDYQAEIWLAIYNVANSLVMCHLRDADPFVLLLEAQVMNVTDYLRVAIHGTLVYYYARSKKRRRAFEHTGYFLRYLPTMTTTANILPVYGLIFGAMAFYYMAEHGNKDYYEAVNDDYDLYINCVNNLNQAFQKVKFWEFMQPCLYLARALPYISTDRTMEGYMVLSHGLKDMHFMHEIKFLRAFYCSVLGKYAFHKEERIDWTNQARGEFIRLGIPHEEYCNPDPSLPASTAMMCNLPSYKPSPTNSSSFATENNHHSNKNKLRRSDM